MTCPVDLKLEYSTIAAPTPVELSGVSFSNVRLETSYVKPDTMTFTLWGDVGSPLLSHLNFLTLSETVSDPDLVLFEGWVEEVDEIDPGQFRVTAYEATVRASQNATLGSEAWSQNDYADETTRPAFVANCANVDDPDYARTTSIEATVGGIIKTMLDFQTRPLLAANVFKSGSPGYVQTELDALTIIPQHKFVAYGEPVFEAIERLLMEHMPTWKAWWESGERRFRFIDQNAATQETLTVGPAMSPSPRELLSIELERQTEGVASAVRIVGPEEDTWDAMEWRTGDATAPMELVTVAGSTPDGNACISSFNINATKFETEKGYALTRILLRASEPTYVTGGQFMSTDSSGTISSLLSYGVPVYSPYCEAFYDSRGWIPAGPFLIDPINLTLNFLDCVYSVDGSGVEINPTKIRLSFPREEVPLQVRYPDFPGGWTDGDPLTHEGDVFDAGYEYELRLYDEMLATGYWQGELVTTSTRLSRMQLLAQEIHKLRSRFTITGGLSFDGAQIDLLSLGRRFNLEVFNDSGTEIAAGWNDMNAWLTEVTIDFSEGITTCLVSSDHAEMLGIDTERMKERLNIRPAVAVPIYSFSSIFNTERQRATSRTLIGQDITAKAGLDVVFVDENGGLQ